MTTLAIMATYEKKRLKCYGTVAAGEHVAVTVTDGAQWMGEGKALRIRVLFGPVTVAVFPFADGDTWTTAGTQDADAACELNLNTVQAEKYLKHGGTCLWILDDVENHTLYATGEFDVLPWPKRRGIDEPIDLDGYPQLVEDIEELKEAWDEYQRTIARELAAKQDAINDLSEIREGASAGASALQPAEILDGGKVKSDLLPSYVDDVLEFASRSAFPATGESGKIYVALDTNRTYRWGGTQYTEIANPALDDAVTPTSANGVKSRGIWSAIWGSLTELLPGFASLYDWCVSQLAGKASKSDATLTPIYSDTPTFSEWTISPQADIELQWIDDAPSYWLAISDTWGDFVAVEAPEDATKLSFTGWDGIDYTATRFRTDIIGYTLGSQTDKPLQPKGDYANRAPNPTAGNLAALDANGNPVDSGVKASDKLDASSASAPFSSDSSVSYPVGSHCTYNGKLYVCTTATTGGTWVAASWTADVMDDPDAVLDITAQNQLRVVAKDGTLLWAQGYYLASTSSATLACDATNNFTFADGATTQAFTLPTAPTGKVGDFGLDIDNSANTGAATMTLTGLDTTFSVVVPEGESLNDMLAIAAGELARFYITLSTFRVNNLPTWHIVKQVVENGGAQS